MQLPPDSPGSDRGRRGNISVPVGGHPDLPSDFGKRPGEMMGGLGSGGWNRSGRGTVEEHRSLTIGQLRRERVLIDGWHGSGGWSARHRTCRRHRHCRSAREHQLSTQARAGEKPWQEIDEPVAIHWRSASAASGLFLPGCARPVLKVWRGRGPLSLPALQPAGLRLVAASASMIGPCAGPRRCGSPRRPPGMAFRRRPAERHAQADIRLHGRRHQRRASIADDYAARSS